MWEIQSKGGIWKRKNNPQILFDPVFKWIAKFSISIVGLGEALYCFWFTGSFSQDTQDENIPP